MLDVASAFERLLAQPIAHRGLHACGGRGWVENSLGAAEAALSAGWAIECDVQLSRDGEAMVFHDTSLDRLTGLSGLMGAYDAASLREMRLRGSSDHIPTLAEFLAAIDCRGPLVIEVKSEHGSGLRLTDRTLACLQGYAGVVALESFDPEVVLHCRRAGAERPIGLVGPPEKGMAISQDALASCDFVSWSIDSIADLSRLCPALPRSTWTVRSAAQAAVAGRHGAQIVFEGFTPSSSINPLAEQ